MDLNPLDWNHVSYLTYYVGSTFAAVGGYLLARVVDNYRESRQPSDQGKDLRDEDPRQPLGEQRTVPLPVVHRAR